MENLTRLIKRVESGDQEASDELLPIVYQELRRLAQFRLNNVPNQTLQATALVHEAYLRLVGGATDQQWDGKGHFFAAAAESMRRIVVESARRKSRKKHGGEFRRCDISMSAIIDSMKDTDVESLDSVLTIFQSEFPKHAELIKLRFFAGLPESEAAAAMGISRATASRYWTFGRTWLFNEIKKRNDND